MSNESSSSPSSQQLFSCLIHVFSLWVFQIMDSLPLRRFLVRARNLVRGQLHHQLREARDVCLCLLELLRQAGAFLDSLCVYRVCACVFCVLSTVVCSSTVVCANVSACARVRANVRSWPCV